jgi:hypothetical protein
MTFSAMVGDFITAWEVFIDVLKESGNEGSSARPRACLTTSSEPTRTSRWTMTDT